MKKTALIVVLALAVVLAFGATPAFAKYAGFSATAQYVDWTVAQSMASQNADAALMAKGPHNGYGTTTIKCAVCHSVHRGDTSLLNEGANCAVCHTNAYYGGTALAKTVSWTVTTAGTSAGGPHASFVGCGGGATASEGCHAGPHGEGASDYNGPSSKLLETNDTRLVAAWTANFGAAPATTTTWTANMAAIGTDAVCTRCHSNSVFGVVTAGTKLDVTPGVVGLTTATGHRVVAAARTAGASGWNASGTEFPTTKTGIQVAWKPVSYCDSCHDLTDDNNGGATAFPHAINDVVSTAQQKVKGNRSAVWLTAAPDSATQSLAVSGYNQYSVVASSYPAVSNVSGAAGSTILDGICLKCHRSATDGIGISF